MTERGDEVRIRGGSRGRCPYCHDACTASDDNLVCNECLARHHRACWREGGDRCAACTATVPARRGGSGREKVQLAPPPTTATASPAPARPGSSRLRAGGSPLARLPQDVRRRLEAELAEGEQLVWAGQPQRTLRAHLPATLPALLFGLPWTAFALFWTLLPILALDRSEAGLIGVCFPLFGLPFVLIGFFLLSSPYRALRAAARTGYAITDRRLLICVPDGPSGPAVQSYGPDALSSLTRTDRADGSGDLVLHEERDGDGTVVRGHGLLAIRRVREVEALLRETLRGR